MNNRELYGAQATAKQSIVGIDDNTVAYVSGHNIIIYNLDTKTSSFIQGKWLFRELVQGLTFAAHLRTSQAV